MEFMDNESKITFMWVLVAWVEYGWIVVVFAGFNTGQHSRYG